MIDRLLAAAGVDPRQWRALTRAYLTIDRRSHGGFRRAGDRTADNAFISASLLLILILNGVLLGALTVRTPDPFTAAAVVMTYIALTIALMVLLEFTAIVISPNDYWIVGSRPVDSRTYFAARLASILAYVASMAAMMAALPAFAFLLWHRAGVAASLSLFLTTVLCATTASTLTIAFYAALVTRLRPRHVTRVLSAAQLLAATLFLGGYYLVMQAFERAHGLDIRLAGVGWIWAIPSTWFAAIVPAVLGTAGPREWTGAAAAALLTALSVPAGAGRFSMRFSERLSDLPSAAPAAAGRTSRSLPGFGAGEAYAIATLIRAQFRYDTRFRMAILSMVPVTAFYLLIGLDKGALKDPFGASYEFSGTPVYFVIAFLPLSLHGSLQYSESWRAAWIFMATPADAARLAVAAKNFVAVFFLGGYLLALAIFWSVFYEQVWHAFVHAAVLGAMAHFLLQAAVMLHPVLPFTAEPRRGEQSSRLMWLFAFGALVGTLVPLALPFIYAEWWSLCGLVVILAATTAGLEFLVRVRAREASLAAEL